MSSVAVAPRKSASKKPRDTMPPGGWWGGGKPPTARWPGATIEIPAVWRQGRSRWESPDGQYYFDQGEADRACAFFPTYLRHHIGEFAGEPFALLDYQRLLLTRPIFGWKRGSDGLRRFRKVFAFLPKGAGKSPWGAATGLYLAFCDNEPGAEVYAIAADKKQARTVHDNARLMVTKMIEIEPEFEDLFEILRDEIRCVHTNSTYQVISSDAATKHGFRPHGVIYDEMHAAKNRHLYEAQKKSMVKRRQPLMVIITHAGHDDEGICYEEYEYAKSVLSGTIQDETCLPVIFEMQPEDDWTDPKVWARVNPGHGITVKADGIAQECQEAINEPRKRNDFLMFHGNRWVNQATAWIPTDWWDACADPLPSHAELAKLPCAIGIDMAQKIDLASVVAVFRVPLEESTPTAVEVVAEEDTGAVVTRTHSLNYRIAVLPAFWLPDDTLRDHVKTDRVPYDLWAAQGLLKVTDGAVIDSDAIVRYFKDPQKRGGDLVTLFPLIKQAEIGYDPAFATDIGVRLRDDLGFTTVEVLQNYKHLSEACQVFEALVKAKRVLHGGHRLLRWNLEHIAIKRDDAGRIRPVKPKKSTKRIDGIVALLIALSRVMVMPPTVKKRSAGVIVV